MKCFPRNTLLKPKHNQRHKSWEIMEFKSVKKKFKISLAMAEVRSQMAPTRHNRSLISWVWVVTEVDERQKAGGWRRRSTSMQGMPPVATEGGDGGRRETQPVADFGEEVADGEGCWCRGCRREVDEQAGDAAGCFLRSLPAVASCDRRWQKEKEKEKLMGLLWVFDHKGRRGFSFYHLISIWMVWR